MNNNIGGGGVASNGSNLVNGIATNGGSGADKIVHGGSGISNVYSHY